MKEHVHNFEVTHTNTVTGCVTVWCEGCGSLKIHHVKTPYSTEKQNNFVSAALCLLVCLVDYANTGDIPGVLTLLVMLCVFSLALAWGNTE